MATTRVDKLVLWPKLGGVLTLNIVSGGADTCRWRWCGVTQKSLELVSRCPYDGTVLWSTLGAEMEQFGAYVQLFGTKILAC